ncbi:MAG: hypothetical protein FWD94_05040 [Treponema sp.]|nr:hypothetical protein [Treponema sp.]
MANDLTKEQFIKVLLDDEITKPYDKEVLQVFYSCKEHKASSDEAGKMLGHGMPLNLWVGDYAKRIATKHDIGLSTRESQKYKFWDLFFDGGDTETPFIWQLKPDLAEAIYETILTKEQ